MPRKATIALPSFIIAQPLGHVQGFAFLCPLLLVPTRLLSHKIEQRGNLLTQFPSRSQKEESHFVS